MMVWKRENDFPMGNIYIIIIFSNSTYLRSTQCWGEPLKFIYEISGKKKGICLKNTPNHGYLATGCKYIFLIV